MAVDKLPADSEQFMTISNTQLPNMNKKADEIDIEKCLARLGFARRRTHDTGAKHALSWIQRQLQELGASRSSSAIVNADYDEAKQERTAVLIVNKDYDEAKRERAACLNVIADLDKTKLERTAVLNVSADYDEAKLEVEKACRGIEADARLQADDEDTEAEKAEQQAATEEIPLVDNAGTAEPEVVAPTLPAAAVPLAQAPVTQLTSSASGEAIPVAADAPASQAAELQDYDEAKLERTASPNVNADYNKAELESTAVLNANADYDEAKLEVEEACRGSEMEATELQDYDEAKLERTASPNVNADYNKAELESTAVLNANADYDEAKLEVEEACRGSEMEATDLQDYDEAKLERTASPNMSADYNKTELESTAVLNANADHDEAKLEMEEARRGSEMDARPHTDDEDSEAEKAEQQAASEEMPLIDNAVTAEPETAASTPPGLLESAAKEAQAPLCRCCAGFVAEAAYNKLLVRFKGDTLALDKIIDKKCLLPDCEGFKAKLLRKHVHDMRAEDIDTLLRDNRVVLKQYFFMRSSHH
eukprot:TRINITY_DN9039_c0_g2_i4.p1 TRINITY_DN9039_c0_g2~~TRINITY_DN9039_c0_g2_i4.p1  ORF type:complete len:538 (-),score=195.89 TRINITY_DN9039_c0_g2_i4:545-2158(-)